ncbi:DUF2333 family protein [Paracoccus sp. (in: a-proteobacteria)]|uniref:DUF2333 family protein n=1 Tax=Paracoccus sp. TaxID=267 RepID=UPI00272B854F|nr:DUF2333 family protein [Paracoccus sp. (in: a-proteobacteria)]
MDKARSIDSATVRPPRQGLLRRFLASGPRVALRRLALALLLVGVLFYGVIGSLLSTVDADVDFMPPSPVAGGSHAVNMAEALILREVQTNRWAPNDPPFFPTAMHDNMANFQRGMMRAIGRFTLQLEIQVGRLRGSSAIDEDLKRASGLLQFPTDVWLFDFNQSLLPVQPAEVQYEAAARALRNYNLRIAGNTAIFETRADALALTVEQMADELGARAALIDAHIAAGHFVINTQSDDIFYANKGMAYASYLLLRELGRDFDRVIQSQGLGKVWFQSLESLRHAAEQRPAVVLNGRGVNSLIANHLQIQGFYLKRAILQLDEVARVIRAGR